MNIRTWVVAATVLGSMMACGGGQLQELPLSTANVERRGIVMAGGTTARDVWLLHRNPLGGGGAPGNLAYWNGERLVSVTLPVDAQTTSMAVVGPNEVITAGTQVLRVQGTTITDITDQTAGAASFRVASRGDGVVYAIGRGALLRRAAGGNTFEMLASPEGGMSEFVVAAPDRIIAVGDGNGTTPDVVYTFNGTAWQMSSPQRTARRLSAAAFEDAWAMPLPDRSGTPMQVLSWDGTNWTTVMVQATAPMVGGATPTLTMHGVVALGRGRVGVVVLREYNSVPPRSEVVWITGDRFAIRNESVVKVHCTDRTTTTCMDGLFTGAPFLTSDNVLFVGPYYGSVPVN